MISMKKFLQLYLICQLFVCCFIYAQSIYDIYTLNNLGSDYDNEFYLENVSGENLGKLYDVLIENGASIEIIKTPISEDAVLEYEIYSTAGDDVRKMYPITNDKKFSYYELTREDFVDSTGRFQCNWGYRQIYENIKHTELIIKEYQKDDISYAQVFINNGVNIAVLVILSQFVLFVYTFMRIKINAVKKLLGYSSRRMVLDSFFLFCKMETVAGVVVLLLHGAYCVFRGKGCSAYFLGLLGTIVVVLTANLIMLFVTQVSIRTIDISAMIKNKVYSGTWNNSMMVLKIVFVVILTVCISIFINQYKEYQATVSEVNQYRGLSKYYTANGFNSDEYEKVFRETETIRETSSNMKKLYHKYADKALLMDINVTEYMSENYYRLYDTSAEQLLHSYKHNYVVVNENYFSEYLQVYDEKGELIKFSDLSEGTVLVPEEYKGAEVEQVCKRIYNDFFRYDDYYTSSDVLEEEKEINVIYIPSSQEINILTFYQLETGKKIKNSIVFIDKGNFAGTWYLSKLSNGEMAFLLEDRNEFAFILQEFYLDNLLNVGTLLTPLSDMIRYYEFTANQAGMFAFLFVVALIFILYLSCYIEIMVNRKQYAVKRLLGFSGGRSLAMAVLPDIIILFLVIPLKMLGCSIWVLVISLCIDTFFLKVLYNGIIIRNIAGNLKGE